MAVSILPAWFHRLISIISSTSFMGLILLCLTFLVYSDYQRRKYNEVEVAIKHGIENCFAIEVKDITISLQQYFSFQSDFRTNKSFETDFLSNQIPCLVSFLERRGLLGMFLTEFNIQTENILKFILKRDELSEENVDEKKYKNSTKDGENGKEFGLSNRENDHETQIGGKNEIKDDELDKRNNKDVRKDEE